MAPEQHVGSSTITSVQPIQQHHFGFIALSSDLTDIMATSRDYDELLFAWKGWRDASGKKIKNSYKRYVELSNKAAVLNGQCSTPLETHYGLNNL